jgi:Flp pilus assembly protein TadD
MADGRAIPQGSDPAGAVTGGTPTPASDVLRVRVTPSDDVARAIFDAEALFRRNEFAAIERLLGKLATEEQTDPAVFRVLGLAQIRRGAVADGIASLRQALRRAPNDPWAAMHLGIGLQTAGALREAATQFERAHQLLPDDPAPLLNWAHALLGVGDAAGAARVAKRARLRAPTMPEAHYIFGQAMLALGRWADAAAACTKATRLSPRFADAWVNLGVAEYRQGHIEAAKTAMRMALQADPNNQAATANLGAFLRLTGGVEEAEQLLRKAGQAPNATEARLNLAAGLLQEERNREALAILSAEQPQRTPLAQHWRLQHALALLNLGANARARAVLDSIGPVPLPLQPLMHWRRTLLALNERDPSAARAHAQAMEAALEAAGESLLPEHRIMGHYDLAKFWSGQNEPARAFPFWERGHKLLARMQPFSRSAYLDFVDATIGRFSRERLHEGPVASDRDATPIFIVGMPRSGTTLAEQIIGAHPSAHPAGERAALAQAYGELGGGWETAAAATRVAACETATLDGAAARYLRDLRALAPNATRIVDKMPGNFRYLGLVATLLPGARVIHCVRDPRDIGLSIFTFRFYGHHAYAHDLADLGWYIGQHDRLMAHWREAMPAPPFTLRLSDWVQDFQGTLARVLDFVGLPYASECERYHERDTQVRTVSRSQVKQPVNARGIGRWRPFERQLAPLIAELERSSPGAL